MSITTSTSAAFEPCTPCAPAKITSFIDCPRTASGDCSPSAHSTASVMFDLPEPFGPTITDTPVPNSSFVRWGKDLKPFIEIERRCIYGAATSSSASMACRAASCSAAFFVFPSPRPSSSPATSATATKLRSCAGPSSETVR